MCTDMSRLIKTFVSSLAILGMAWNPAQAQAQAQAQPQEGSDQVLFFDQPAAQWEHALPVGNGRLGAMIFGGTARERIQFNEETLWSGGPYDPVVEGAHEGLPEIRRMLFDGEYDKAHDLFGRTMMGVPYEQMKYQPMGDLWLDFPGHEDVQSYRRELDLDRAVATTSYIVDGVTFTRDVFSSAVDQVIVIRLSADQPGALTFAAKLHGIRNPAHSNYGTDYFEMDGLSPNQLRLTGKSSDYLGIEGQMRYEARLEATAEGGTMSIDYRTLKVEGADAVTMILAGATNFVNYRDVSADPSDRVDDALIAVRTRSLSDITQDHVEEHQAWFRRVEIAIPGDPDVLTMPLDQRIARLADAEDPALAALYYQFGRYLLIASSRPETEAANLQGIWNDRSNPSWDSKYTVNINLPMNYWPAESGNLSELTGPLWDLVDEVAEAGTSTAKEHWNAYGWVLHQNTDLFRSTTPMDGPSWGAWPVGGAWLMTNLFDTYRFSADQDDLERLYPLLKGQVEFLMDILVEHPETGELVTAPSNSPENFPAFPGNGRFFDEVSGLYLKARTIAVAPTMDMQIIREVFTEFLEAAQTLGRDGDLAADVAEAKDRLVLNRIGKHGQIQEWIEDFDEIEVEHRHLSHLWGLYPGSEITPERDPRMAAAAAVSIERRGTGGCGWSYGWKMGLWARLYNADGALHEFKHHLTDSSLPNMFSLCGRTLQVDGNFGAGASIAEMLLQSHQGFLDFLPALPSEWNAGRVSGLKARGGFEVSMEWNEGQLIGATIHAMSNGSIHVRADGVRGIENDGESVDYATSEDRRVQFDTRVGTTYTLIF